MDPFVSVMKSESPRKAMLKRRKKRFAKEDSFIEVAIKIFIELLHTCVLSAH